jgi:hypothetical protein
MSEHAGVVDRVHVITDAAVGLSEAIAAGGTADFTARTDALPAAIMAGFEGEDDPASPDRADYLGRHLRLVLDIVDEQHPKVVNEEVIVERALHRYEEEHGAQPWPWVRVLVERALPSEFERLYEPTLGRLAMEKHVERAGKSPEPTPWVMAMTPGKVFRTSASIIPNKAIDGSLSIMHRGIAFYHKVTDKS